MSAQMLGRVVASASRLVTSQPRASKARPTDLVPLNNSNRCIFVWRRQKPQADKDARQRDGRADSFERRHFLCYIYKGSSMEPQKQATCESAIQLGDLTINAKGGKYVPLRRNGGPPVWQTAEWQKIIWHPAAFNDPTAKRVGLCLEPDEASTAQLQEIEQHLVRALTALSLSEPKVFGKFLTETDVKDRFQSCLKTSPRGGSYLKLKLDWGRVRIWGPNQEELAEPGDLSGASCARCG